MVASTVNLPTAQELVDPVHLHLHLLHLLRPLAATLQGSRAGMEVIAVVVPVTKSKELGHVLRQEEVW